MTPRRKLFLITVNVGITGFHLISFIVNLRFITIFLQVAFNPVLPKRMHPIIAATPLGLFYPYMYPLDDEISEKSISEQVLHVFIEHAPTKHLIDHFQLSAFLLLVSVASSTLLKRYMPRDEDFEHLRGSENSDVRNANLYTKLMFVLSKVSIESTHGCGSDGGTGLKKWIGGARPLTRPSRRIVGGSFLPCPAHCADK